MNCVLYRVRIISILHNQNNIQGWSENSYNQNNRRKHVKILNQYVRQYVLL